MTLVLSQPAGELRITINMKTPPKSCITPLNLNRPRVEMQQMVIQTRIANSVTTTASPVKTVPARKAGDRILEKVLKSPRHVSTPSLSAHHLHNPNFPGIFETGVSPIHSS